jgi:NAD(P)-dependent dehydrogenase (short-subunit alcohol dehydrogenase family)
MNGLAGKVAIVTGAADGLGRATSRKMATSTRSGLPRPRH